MKHIHATILAAGASQRFQSPYSKLIAPLCGKPLVRYPIDTVRALNIPMTVIVGHQASHVQAAIGTDQLISYAYQEHQRGTGDALMCGTACSAARHMLVINGDMPLVTPEMIRTLIQRHTQQRAAITFVTARVHNGHAGGYGTVHTDKQGHMHIIEARERAQTGEASDQINAGIYLCQSSFLEEACHALFASYKHDEAYITDLVGYASRNGYTIATVDAPFERIQGVNTIQELQSVEAYQQACMIQHHIQNGVRFRDPERTYVDTDASIASGTYIEPGAVIQGHTHIATACHIGAYTIISDSVIEAQSYIAPHSYITESRIHSGCCIGPFAHIRNHSIVGKASTIGNFAEVAASKLASETKAKHMSYLGNTHTQPHVNIGAGTVICNYDGEKKHTTYIKEGAFIGGNTTCVAPLTIEDYALIGAGSVITRDVPSHALAIARERETIKHNYTTQMKSAMQRSPHEPTHSDEATGA